MYDARLALTFCDGHENMRSFNFGAVMMMVSPNRLLAKLVYILAPFSYVSRSVTMTAVHYFTQHIIVLPCPKRKNGMRLAV